MQPQRPRRPVHYGPDAMEAHGPTHDPMEQVLAAHETAAVLVHAGRSSDDAEVTGRLVDLVEHIGMPALASLWSARPARSLPGALWRLFALREWVTRSPEQAAREYAAGMRFSEVSHAVAGVAEPPGPDQLRSLTSAILTGVFDGDLAVALDRAAAFCLVVAAGRADLHEADPHPAASLLETGRDLSACANLWRKGLLR